MESLIRIRLLGPRKEDMMMIYRRLQSRLQFTILILGFLVGREGGRRTGGLKLEAMRGLVRGDPGGDWGTKELGVKEKREKRWMLL